jgi:hypothetical protein
MTPWTGWLKTNPEVGDPTAARGKPGARPTDSKADSRAENKLASVR